MTRRRKRRKGAKFAIISLPVRLIEEIERIVETSDTGLQRRASYVKQSYRSWNVSRRNWKSESKEKKKNDSYG